MMESNYQFTEKQLVKITNIRRQYDECIRRLLVASGEATGPWWDPMLTLIDLLKVSSSVTETAETFKEHYYSYPEIESDYLILREATEIVLADKLKGELEDILEVQKGAEKWLELI